MAIPGITRYNHTSVMTQPAQSFLSPDDFQRARERVSPHIYHTPLLTSRMLSEQTGYDIRLKADIFERTGSYKIRGPLNKFSYLTEDQKRRGVICKSRFAGISPP